MTDPALQSEILSLRQRGLNYSAISRILRRSFPPGRRPFNISSTAVRKICGEPARDCNATEEKS